MNKIFNKIKNRIWNRIISKTRHNFFYTYLYKSFWHYNFSDKKTADSINYYTAVPNIGAGIGHQMANWIAGYWFAQQFELSFANIPFPNLKWDDFLGFGVNEEKMTVLLTNGYKKVRLPLFDEYDALEVALQKKIIASYSKQKVVFIAEQDQFYSNQFGLMEIIKEKFYTAPARIKDQIIFDPKSFNIAIHVRRGDIVNIKENQNPNLLLRWQGNDYFEKVLNSVVKSVKTNKPIAIYLFSQGEKKEFPEFEQFSNLHYLLDMNSQDSFLHMVFADLLITSKSSFSYKPALISNGIKVCPKSFWHGYPNDKSWILVDEDGSLPTNAFQNL